MLRKKSLLSLYAILLTPLFTFLPISALADPITPHGTARFETPNATININNSSSSYKVIWMNAIRAWNNTGLLISNFRRVQLPKSLPVQTPVLVQVMPDLLN